MPATIVSPDKSTALNLVIAELNLAVAKIDNGDSKASVMRVLESAQKNLVKALRLIGGQDLPRDDND